VTVTDTGGTDDKGVAAIVLSAGSSQRFGGEPKQFADLGGVTVLERAVRAFVVDEGIDEVWVVTSAEHLDRTRELLADAGVRGVVLGGSTRAESTVRGLEALGESVSRVLIHDAARPLVPASVVAACVQALEHADIVATVIEPADSVVILVGDDVAAMPDRSTVRLHQTPQGFRRSLLAAAWEHTADGDQPTDDVTVALRAFPDVPVAWIEGDPRSAKITRPADLVALRALLAEDG
jgi:2-C-methyl-D-erythritol 4-phosphate cytidylyltransferase